MINFSKKIASLPLLLLLALQIMVWATPQEAKAAGCDFGNFEVGIPGIAAKGSSICDFINGGNPFLKVMAVVIKAVTAFIVIAGLIMIIVGGYFIMLAGGDSGRIGTGKTLIKSALFGIVLALVAFLILNTISSQFAGDLNKDPELDLKPLQGR